MNGNSFSGEVEIVFIHVNIYVRRFLFRIHIYMCVYICKLNHRITENVHLTVRLWNDVNFEVR